MNPFERFIKATQDATWKKQEPWKWFHFSWIFGVLLLSILSSLFLTWKKKSKCVQRIFLLVISIFVIIMEAWNQTQRAFSFDDESNTVTWKFDVYWAPWQFCDTPTFLNVAAALLCNGKVRNAILCFLGTYTLVAGAVVYLDPQSLTDYTGTGVVYLLFYFSYHGCMILVGITLLSSVIEPKHKSFFYAFPVFLAVVAIAQIFNVSVYYGSKKVIALNFFHISPFADCTECYPFIGALWKNYYSLFLLSFLALFTFAAYFLLVVRILLGWVVLKVMKKFFRKKKLFKEGEKYEFLLQMDETLSLAEDVEDAV